MITEELRSCSLSLKSWSGSLSSIYFLFKNLNAKTLGMGRHLGQTAETLFSQYSIFFVHLHECMHVSTAYTLDWKISFFALWNVKQLWHWHPFLAVLSECFYFLWRQNQTFLTSLDCERNFSFSYNSSLAIFSALMHITIVTKVHC